MKFLKALFLALCLLLCTQATALFSDRNFDQDRMITTNYGIIVLTPFEDEDRISNYNEYGTLIWEVTLLPKVMSWKLKDGLLYVFSKSRYQEISYLTCVDPVKGSILWERP